MPNTTPRGIEYNISPDQWGYAGAQKRLAVTTDAALSAVEAGAVAYADLVGEEAAAHARTLDAETRAALTAQVDRIDAEEVTGRVAALLLGAWDGPVADSATAPDDQGALWVTPDMVVRQWTVAPSTPGVRVNHAPNTFTRSLAGVTAAGLEDVRVVPTSDPLRGRIQGRMVAGQAPNLRLGAEPTSRIPLGSWPAGQPVSFAVTVGTTTPGLQANLRIWWYNDAAAPLAFSSYNGPTVDVTEAGAVVKVAQSPPSGAVAAGVSILTYAAAATEHGGRPFWAERMHAGSTAYVDGDTPGYRWSGTPGESVTVSGADGWYRVTDVADLSRPKTGPGPEAAALLAAAWDGPVAVTPSAPDDTTALWVGDGGVAQQWVDGKDPDTTHNRARQTGTTSATGWFAPAASAPPEVVDGMVRAPFIAAATPQFQMISTEHATPVTPGQAVTIAADVEASVPAATTWAMRIVWRDAAGGILSSSTGSGHTMPAGLSTRISQTATAPTGAALATWTVLGVGALGVAAAIRTGRVSVTLDGSTAYVDGDTPGYQWSGAPGESTTVGAPDGWYRVTDVADLIHRRQRGGGGSGGSRPLWDTHAGDMHAVAEQKLRARRGGTIGVGTTTQVISIRFDHGAQEALDMGILDACDRLDLPYTMCLNAEASIPAEKPIPWADVRRLVAGGGMEVNNHSLTHSPDAPTEADQQAQIIDGLRKLQERVPDQAVEVWTQPGLYDTKYGGYNEGDDPLRYIDTVAGRMIHAHHGFATGLTRGRYVPLDGTIPTGMQTVIVDTNSAAHVQSNLNRLWSLSPRGRTVVALHPERCTRDPLGSFQPASEIIKWLEWIAAERDAGRVEVLTHAGMAIADAGTHRQALLTSSGSTVSAGASRSWQAGTTALAGFMPAVFGAMWQAKAVLTSPTGGDVTVTATCGSATATKTVTLAPNKPTTIRRHITLPLGTRGDIPTVTITAGTGDVTVTGLRLQAV